jgi:hypothetical protein
MLNRNVPVYSGPNFEVCTQYLLHTFKEHWEAGHIVEKKKPWPTKKKPDRTTTVYFWVGIPDSTIRLHDVSAEMGPEVTVKAVIHDSFVHKMMVRAWRPSFTVVPA